MSLIFVSSSNAGIHTGLDFYNYCSEIDHIPKKKFPHNYDRFHYCLGYMKGFLDRRNIVIDKVLPCDTPDVEIGEIIIVVLKYLKRFPDLLIKPPVMAIEFAINEEWCGVKIPKDKQRL